MSEVDRKCVGCRGSSQGVGGVWVWWGVGGWVGGWVWVWVWVWWGVGVGVGVGGWVGVGVGVGGVLPKVRVWQ